MKITKEKFSSFLEKLGLYVIGGLTTAISLFLVSVSLFHTTAVKFIHEGQGVSSVVYNIREHIESVIYYNDNFFLNLIILAACLVICFFLMDKFKKITLKSKLLFIFLWTFVLGTIWVTSSQTAPSEDSYRVTSASWEFAQNHFAKLTDEPYFRNYSFQLGYVLFNEIIIRISKLLFSVENLLFLEVLNAFFLAVIYVYIVKINDKLFGDDRITNLTILLLALSFAPLIDCVFIYGIFPGMMFAAIALYYAICWMTDGRIYQGILSTVAITLALMVKSNYLIWLIAITIMYIVTLFRRKKYVLDSVFIVVTLALALSVQPAVKSLYEARSDHDLGDSIPYMSWIAMGLSETDLAPGWYNYSYTVSNFEASGFDAKEASRRSQEVIKERIKYFIDHPQYANDFFYLKTVSQWNDTAYQSIWNNVVRQQFKEKNKLADWVCYEGEDAVRTVIDWIAQLVFFGFFVGCVYLLRSKKFMYTPLPLVFLGGFLYQMISEGKSQYIIPYYIVMAGFAAFGIVKLYDKIAAIRAEKAAEKADAPSENELPEENNAPEKANETPSAVPEGEPETA